MNRNNETYIIELESKIQILERENDILSVKAEENLLLNRAFDEINVSDDVDKLLLNTLEGISVLLNIQFSGIFDFNNNSFSCISNYALFSNNDTLSIKFSVSDKKLHKIQSKETCVLGKSEFSFDFPENIFIANEALVIALDSEFLRSRYFVFINDETSGQMDERIPLIEKVIRIITSKLERIFYQNELERLNEELEQKVEIRTLELLNQNKEYLALNEEILKAKENVETINANIKAIIEGTENNIWAFDRNYNILYINQLFQQEFLKTFGVNLVPGVNLVEALPEPLRPVWKPRYDRTLANEQFTVEDAVDTGNGMIYIQVSFNPIVQNGKAIGGSCFGSNITTRKIEELELIKAKQKAEESDRLKTAFLQNMSHEIRTPMNAIMGFSGLLVENFDNKEKLEKFSDIIHQRCIDLLDIINDILDIAKIESGQLTVNIEDCNISELFSELELFFTEYQRRINKQHINFSFVCNCEKSYNLIKTDKVKLKQILINLVGNAFKFTEYGSIECGCKPENNSLLFYVSDTGVGVPVDKHNEIFERFTQIPQNSAKNISGTGLGLSIVKGLVDLLGGKVWLDSEINQGTTFYFSVKYDKPNEVQSINSLVEEKQHINGINKSLLIVEDDYFNAEYLKEILNRTGFQVIIAETGAAAIQVVSTLKIDLVLMDVRLPDMSGYEITRKIKHLKPTMKIIAQTAYAAQDERQKAIDAGCIDYISKPTKRELLLTLLNKYL